MPFIPTIEPRQLKHCEANVVYGDPEGSYIAAIALGIVLALVFMITVKLISIITTQNKELKELRRAYHKASAYKATVQTAQAEAIASQLKVDMYEKDNLHLTAAVEQWQKKYVELASNHHTASRRGLQDTSVKEPSSPKRLEIVPPITWHRPGNSPLRQVESVSPTSSTASSEYEGFSESTPPNDGYYGSNGQSFTARTERMVAHGPQDKWAPCRGD
ncbi:hypothetical protein IL306_002814 [Fusarium sp. DS 682]|nr:hypothetical protein IL306_002814 [Fusarium sp. DS 682]